MQVSERINKYHYKINNNIAFTIDHVRDLYIERHFLKQMFLFIFVLVMLSPWDTNESLLKLR